MVVSGINNGAFKYSMSHSQQNQLLRENKTRSQQGKDQQTELSFRQREGINTETVDGEYVQPKLRTNSYSSSSVNSPLKYKSNNPAVPTNAPKNNVVPNSASTQQPINYGSWAIRQGNTSGVVTADPKANSLNLNAQQRQFKDVKSLKVAAAIKQNNVDKALADYSKKGPVHAAAAKLYDWTKDLDSLNKAVSKVIPSEVEIAKKRDAILSNVSVKVSQPGKEVREYTLKDVHRKRLAQANSSPIASGVGSLVMSKYNYLDAKPVNAGIDVAKLYAEMQLIGGAMGAVTKISGKALTGVAWKAKKFTPRVSSKIPESVPRLKADIGKIDDAIAATESAVIRHAENTIAPVGIFGAGAYTMGKPIADTYKNKNGVYLNKFDAEKAAVEKAVEALAVLPLGASGYKYGDKFSKSLIEHSKAFRKEKVDISKIVDPDVLSGKIQESSVPVGTTVQELIKSAETNKKGVYAGWNAADVPMENYVPFRGKLKSDSRPPKIPQKDNSGTFISPEKYGAHVRFIRLADETEAYTTLDVVSALKIAGKAVRDAVRPSQKATNTDATSQLYSSKTSNEVAVSTSNKVVDLINAVSEVTAKIFGEPQPFDPTISHIRVNGISRHSSQAVNLAQKNPGVKIFKDEKGLHEGLKIAQEEIMSEKAKGKTYITLAAEKLLKSGSSAEPELQIAPNTEIKRIPGLKDKVTWYKGRAVRIREYEIVKEIVGGVANTNKIVQTSVKSSGLIGKITKNATKKISYSRPTKRGVFYNLKGRYAKAKNVESEYSGTTFTENKNSILKYSESKSPGSKYSGSKYSESKYSGSKNSGSKYSGSKYSGSKYSGSKYSGSKHSGSKYSGNKYSSPKSFSLKYPGNKYSELKYPGNKYSSPKYPGGKTPIPKPPVPTKPFVLKRKKNSEKVDAKRLKVNVKLSRNIRNQIGTIATLFGETTIKPKVRTTKRSKKSP